MSNPESDPEEPVFTADGGTGIQILEPCDVQLGGPRAMSAGTGYDQQNYGAIWPSFARSSASIRA